MNASTYHKNRKSQQREKGSFLGVWGRKKSTVELQARDEANKVIKDDKTSTHKSFSASPRARMQLFVLWKPWEVGNRTLPRARRNESSPVDFRASRPGLSSPRGQGRRGGGRLAARLGSGKWEEGWKGASGVWGTAGQNISIPYQLLPATNQPSQGAVSVWQESSRWQPVLREAGQPPGSMGVWQDWHLTLLCPVADNTCLLLKNKTQSPRVIPATQEVFYASQSISTRSQTWNPS